MGTDSSCEPFQVYSTLFTKSTTQNIIRRPQSRQDNRKNLINKKTRTETKSTSMTVLKLLIFNYLWEREVFFSAEYEPAVCCSKLKIITISFHAFHSLLEKIQLRYLSSTPTSQKLRSSSCQSVSQELVISATQVHDTRLLPDIFFKAQPDPLLEIIR